MLAMQHMNKVKHITPPLGTKTFGDQKGLSLFSLLFLIFHFFLNLFIYFIRGLLLLLLLITL